jgi:Zn-dependent protease with chaperone function
MLIFFRRLTSILMSTRLHVTAYLFQATGVVAKIPLWSVTLKPVDWDVLNKTWYHGSGGEHPDTVAYTIGGGIIYIYLFTVFVILIFLLFVYVFLLLWFYYFIISSSMVSAGIIERKLRRTKVRLFTVPCCSIILFSSEGMEKKRIWIYS